jgi:hypothetical protein
MLAIKNSHIGLFVNEDWLICDQPVTSVNAKPYAPQTFPAEGVAC